MLWQWYYLRNCARCVLTVWNGALRIILCCTWVIGPANKSHFISDNLSDHQAFELWFFVEFWSIVVALLLTCKIVSDSCFFRLYLSLNDGNPMCCILVAELRGDVYWRTPFQQLCDVRHLTRFIVLDSEMISVVDRRHIPGQGHESCRVWSEMFDTTCNHWPF